MIWDEVLDRLANAGLNPVEETYMENYGKILSVERPEFRGRIIRCTYGKVRCAGLGLEIFLFPSETHLQDFMELMGDDPWWLPRGNAVFHFPVSDPEVVDRILQAVS